MKVALLSLLLLFPGWSQTSKFVQAELLKSIKAKSAKTGEVVRAKIAGAVTLAGGTNLPAGTVLLGQVRDASPNTLSISFDEADMDGKKIPLALSIRAAMMPGASQRSAAATTGEVIGMPGVKLTTDDSDVHASKFDAGNEPLQLNKGLLLMLAAPQKD